MDSEQRLYRDLAELWPLLSPPDHYAAEAQVVRAVLDDRLPTTQGDRPRALLELGAGGGHTLCHLSNAFECVAADLSEAMLAHCRTLNPDVQTVVGDMRTLRLDRTFDAVLVHDAIDYMRSEADVALRWTRPRPICLQAASRSSPPPTRAKPLKIIRPRRINATWAIAC